MKKYLLLIFMMLAPKLILAQLDQLTRINIPISQKEIEKNFNVHSLKNNGVLLVTESEIENTYKNTQWTFTRYDTLIKFIWKREHTLSSRLQPMRSYINDKNFYIFFKEKENLKISIMRMEIASGESEVIEGRLPTPIETFNEFKVMGNIALIAGRINNRPVIVSFRFFDGKAMVLPDLYDSHFDLNSININDEKNIADVLISENNKRKNQIGMHIKSYAYSGKLLQEIELKTAKDKILQTGKLSHFTAEQQFLIGNFAERKTSHSSGIYFAKIDNDHQEYIKYYDFTDLKNFFNFLTPKRKQRMEHRIMRRKQLGKSTNLHYQLLVHDVIPYNNEYIVVGEVYYPVYRSNYSNYYGGFGNYGMTPYMSNNLYNPSYFSNSGLYGYPYGRNNNYKQVLDGYKYTHAVVCGFSVNGDLLWDNCFELGNEHINKTLEEIVQVGQDNGNLILMYPQDEKLHTQVIKGNEVIAKKEKFDVKKIEEKNNDKNKVFDVDKFNISHWYDNYFISWGFEDIHNLKEDEGRNKRIFYLSKITYRQNIASRLDNEKTEKK